MISVIINSCGRLDLLERSIASFQAFNTFPIDEYILVDDSGDNEIHQRIRDRYSSMKLILKEHRGLISCVDDAFSQASGDWLFKTEDDWEFYKHGFIERSMDILARVPNILHVWLREQNDTNGHPVEPKLYSAGSTSYRLVSDNFRDEWHGFTFNPSLWRACDYKLMAPFSKIAGDGNMGTQEMTIGQWYHKLGYRGAILTSGCVRHIGWGRRSYSV
jgi:glycosyltransferase involved in cell wall biosynthesis